MGGVVSFLLLPVTVSYGIVESLPVVAWPFFVLGFTAVLTYAVLILAQLFYFDKHPVQLKQKYNASWALVTGASSGIGKSIVKKLAQQDLNVVMVALDDELLEKTFSEYKQQFPKLKFIKVGVNLGGNSTDYMPAIIDATKDITVQIVFNNAGFITTGFFHELPLERSMANFNCNATCSIPITHHFLSIMQKKQLKGFFAYTSSSAGFLPNPLSAMYASTKAFLTMFASSLAAEIRNDGIDVCVVHPSPMATNFFQGTNLGALDLFKNFAGSPDVIADVLIASAGRFVVRDQGWVTIFMRVVLKALDLNFFTELVTRTAHLSGDYKKHKLENAAKKAKAE